MYPNGLLNGFISSILHDWVNMRVKFLVDCEIEIIEGFNELADEAEPTTEVFRVGDEVEFDVFDSPQRFNGQDLEDHPDMVNVQFGDGSVAYCLSKEWYEVMSK